MDDGKKTSEFYLSALAIVAATILLALDKIEAAMWATVVAPATAGYALSRGLAKINPPKGDTAPAAATRKRAPRTPSVQN